MSDDFWKWWKIRRRREAEEAPGNTTAPPLGPLWQVWGRVQPTGNEWIAVASAIQPNGPQDSARTTYRAFQTEELAAAGARKLVIELGESICAEGGRIMDVETDGA